MHVPACAFESHGGALLIRAYARDQRNLVSDCCCMLYRMLYSGLGRRCIPVFTQVPAVAALVRWPPESGRQGTELVGQLAQQSCVSAPGAVAAPSSAGAQGRQSWQDSTPPTCAQPTSAAEPLTGPTVTLIQSSATVFHAVSFLCLILLASILC